jgi:hypothetical protein
MYTINEAIKWSGWMAIIRRMHDPVKLKFFVCCRYHHSFPSFFFLSFVLRSRESGINESNYNKLLTSTQVTHILIILDRHTIDRISCAHNPHCHIHKYIHIWLNVLLSVRLLTDFYFIQFFNIVRRFFFWFLLTIFFFHYCN